MAHHVDIDLQDVETMENDQETVNVVDETCSGSDHESLQQQHCLDDTERAILERLAFKRGKFDAATSQQQQPLFDEEQETLAMQAQVAGGRVTAWKRLEVVSTGYYESPLFNSCFKILFEMTDGAYRETSADLMEFLTEELTQVQKRCKALVQVGGDAGYGSREFQRAVEAWRSSLDMAVDPANQPEQAKNVWGAVTLETTLDRLRHPTLVPEKCKNKRKYADPPLVDVYRQACERLAMELLDGAVQTAQPLLLLQLLLEDFHHVQRRQHALFRAESSAAASESMIPTAGGLLSSGTQLPPRALPFTPIQWHEFEHHALIFKYMVAGVRLVNIPDEIMGPIRNSCIPTPNGVSGAPHLDPEPGRCRRTDGKKWRCARETVPAKKYCERHMHRGRHRSRPATQTTTATTTTTTHE